jgi:hypothetical protein
MQWVRPMMIYDPSTETVVGNLGWVDHGSIWTFSVNTKAESRIVVDGAKYLGLKAGHDGLFRLTHHHTADLAVSVRHCASPEVELASIRSDRGHAHFQVTQSFGTKSTPP